MDPNRPEYRASTTDNTSVWQTPNPTMNGSTSWGIGAVPKPASLVLLAPGGAVMMGRRRRGVN